MGATYGTTKSGVGMASMGAMRPELVMKSIVPVVLKMQSAEMFCIRYSEALSDGICCGLSLVALVLALCVGVSHHGRLKPRIRGSLTKVVSLKRSVKISAVEDSVLRYDEGTCIVKKGEIEDAVYLDVLYQFPSCVARDKLCVCLGDQAYGVTGVCWVLTYLVKYFRGDGRLKPRLRGSLTKAVSLKRSVKIAAVEDSVLHNCKVAPCSKSMKSGRGPGNIGNKLRIYGSDDSCDYHSSVMESTQRQVLLSIYSMAMPISLFRSPWWSRRFLRRYGYWNRRRCRCQSEYTTTKALCGMILILIFAEALSLYGLIVGIILSSRAAVEGEHFTAKGIGMESTAGPEGGQALALRTHL
uniref:Uncharacterized protein n=1 Tax=Brassica oleracea var. oleracea TaxID=109376 RepID=A0A0D3BQP9_BRAOL